MPTTFANTIDGNPIYAKRAEEDQNGLNIDQTYAKKSELPTVNDGTLTIQKNGTTVDTFTANSSSNKTVNIEVPTKTSDLTNDSGFITASDIPAQVQSNWDETDNTDPSYIQNKPSIPAAQVNSDWNASSGVAEILNKPSIPTATSDLTNDSGFITASDVPGAQEQADWNESNSSDPAYIKNKPTIPAAQVNSDWNASSGVAEILNKPSIPTATSDLTNDSGFIKASDVPAAQEQADWNESNSSDPAYIKNKPSIPAAQVNSDWNASSGVAEILNKPSIPTATSDLTNDSGFITSSDVPSAQEQADWQEADSNDPAYIKNKPTIPPAQVNSDWNASSGVAEILNKPSIPSKTSDLQNDSGFITSSDIPAQVQSDWTESDNTDPAYIQNKPSIPSKTSDLQNDSGFITSSDIPAQVQSDWTESDNTDPAYIKNKPSIPAAQVNSDWNASSGVAEILNKPTIRNVPDVGSTDDGKILKATYSGGVGSYAWDNAPSGSSNLVILDHDAIASTYATVSDMVTDIASGKEVIIRRVSSNFTQFYKLARIFSGTPYFIRLEDESTDIRHIAYGWGYVSSNMSFTWSNYDSGIYPRQWISTGGSTVSQYIPDGSHTSGEYIFVRTTSYTPNIFKCISDYTQSGSNTRPDQDTTHWQQVYLIDILNDIASSGGSGGLPSGGSNGQVLTQTSNGPSWEDVPTELPSGGTAGQVLTVTNNGVAWANANSPDVEYVNLVDLSTRFTGTTAILNEMATGKKFFFYEGEYSGHPWNPELKTWQVFDNLVTSEGSQYIRCKIAIGNKYYHIGTPNSTNGRGGDFDTTYNLVIGNDVWVDSFGYRVLYTMADSKFTPGTWIDGKNPTAGDANEHLNYYVATGHHPLNEIIAVREYYSQTSNVHHHMLANHSVLLYRCILEYTESSSTVLPGADSTHWVSISLTDLNLGQIQKCTVTPETVSNYTNTITLFNKYNNGVIFSTGDIENIRLHADINGYPTEIDSVVIQWTVSSLTTLPKIWKYSGSEYHQWTGHASSNNPTVLTVGKTYQLSILNNCYSIAEFA